MTAWDKWPDRLTTVGLLLVPVATVMSLPALGGINSDLTYGTFSEVMPHDWRTGLWIAAALVGAVALIIGIVDHRRAGRRWDPVIRRWGRRWADALIVIACVGALIWALPFASMEYFKL